MRRASVKRDAFELKCYDAVHAAAEPIAAKAAAKYVNAEWTEVRRVLDRLVRQKALSRKKLGGAWRYFV
jgi:hypothetical protein